MEATSIKRLRNILGTLEGIVPVRYEHKLMIGALLAIVAFIPALAIALISLSAVGDTQIRLALLHQREFILGENLNAPMDAEDRLLPLFILTGYPRFLNQLRLEEHNFDTVLQQLQNHEPRGSYRAQLLNEIALLAHHRRSLEAPGISMKLSNDTIQNVNFYFEHNIGHTTADLHHAVDAFVQWDNARFDEFMALQRRHLDRFQIMLMTSEGFALVVCMAVGTVILRLLQAKRQHDASLARQAEWERALSTARKEAVETVSHDLRHPLQVMMLAAEKLQRVTADQLSAQTALDRFMRAAAAMRRLIDTVLNPANIGAETLPTFKKPLDLDFMLQDLSSRFQLIAAAENINLSYRPSWDFPQIVADGTRLEQVVSNLLANAIKFTPTGGSVTLAAAWADSWVTITVADTGCGMSQEQVKNVFNRYWCGGAISERGSGLGLAISKAIIDAHEGRVEVHSTPGQGTAFVVFMPAASVAELADLATLTNAKPDNISLA